MTLLIFDIYAEEEHPVDGAQVLVKLSDKWGVLGASPEGAVDDWLRTQEPQPQRTYVPLLRDHTPRVVR